jgi:crossover junction endodeoxyribonuclease RusA
MAEPLLTLTVGFPPSVNTYWRRKGSNYFIGKPGKLFRENFEAAAFEPCGGRRLGWTQKLAIEIDLYPGDDRVRDTDNYNKGIFDCLVHCGIVENDRQFKRLTVEMFDPEKPGRAVVRLYPYEPRAT